MGRVMRAVSFCLALALLTGCAAEAVPPVPADPTVATTVTTVTTASTASVTAAQTTTTESAATTTAKVATVTKTTVTVTYTTRSKPTTYTLPTTPITYPKPGPTPNPYYPSVGKTPLEQGLTFGGETYKYAYRGLSMSDKEAARIAEFEKTYHVKLEVYHLSVDEYWAGMAAAMMSGCPYDIVRFSGQAFPTPITHNLMAPLDDYLTTADLYNKKVPEKGGFSESALKKTQYNHHLYGVSGVYTLDPMVLFYNKALFGTNDLQTLSCNGNEVRTDWTWECLLPILREVQDPDNGVWGLASHYLGWTPHVVNSYGTDMAKMTGGIWRQNLSDRQVYAAFETIQNYTGGRNGEAVVDPNLSLGSSVEDFLDSGAAAAILPFSFYEEIREKAKQGFDVGIAPLPNAFETQVVADYLGYGAGNGSTTMGILCALAFAKHEVKDAYQTRTDLTPWLRETMGHDNLQAPLGFDTSQGSLTDLTMTISGEMAKGYNITVVLKNYEKIAQNVMDVALK